MRKGIYFYDDYFLAEIWTNDVVEKNEDNPVVLIIKLCCDDEKYLDLTMAKNKKEFRKYFSDFLDTIKNGNDKKLRIEDADIHYKEIVSLYFNYIKIVNGYDVIKNAYPKEILDILMLIFLVNLILDMKGLRVFSILKHRYVRQITL